ncbi:MAG: GNAT family N-acetyltransferase [Anaerolineae bacterium]|nr:GNAT family N-acetyltransferase [Anaerolineae bacterium]
MAPVSGTMPIGDTPFLMGESVYLRPLEPEDLPLLRKWINDPQIRRLIGEVAPSGSVAVQSYFERIQQDRDRIWFVIALRETGRVIGECGLLRMFYPWRNTDLSIILGEKDTWGKGYGTEAILLLLDYAFGYLGMHRVSIGVVAFNERALRFYEKVGFRREGIQRDGYYYNHTFSDFVMMSILEDEFRER